MSGARSRHSESRRTGRQVRRTRGALLDTFSKQAQSRPYEEIRIADVAEAADVGRSTFYEHFGGKDDLLLESLSPVLEVLSGAAEEADDLARLELVLSHFRENRRLARQFFSGTASRQALVRFGRDLAGRIEHRLASRLQGSGRTPVLPRQLVAAQAAQAVLGLLRAWLESEEPCSAAELAAGMRRGITALVSALVH
jgi:AcrR family transcriptional regulator